MKEAFDRKARNLKHGVWRSVRAAAESIRGLFAVAPGVVDKNLTVIVGHAPGTRKKARPEASFVHFASWDALANAFSGCARSTDVPPAASMPYSPGTHHLRDHSGDGV